MSIFNILLGAKKTDDGINVSSSLGSSESITPDKTARQTKPKGSYVYAHKTPDGHIFYIGKGTGNRAWSKDRHNVWHYYVTEYLNNDYSVVILHDGLDDEQAEELEAKWINQEKETLVNWISNQGNIDYEKNETYHRRRNRTRGTIKAIHRDMEDEHPEKAIEFYRQAIEGIKKYAFIEFSSGLVHELQKEMRGHRVAGEVEAIDRLTLMLKKQGRKEQARHDAMSYFMTYRDDMYRTKQGEAVLKRVGLSSEEVELNFASNGIGRE